MLSLFSFDTIIQFSSDTIVVVSIRSLSVCVGGGGGGGAVCGDFVLIPCVDVAM